MSEKDFQNSIIQLAHLTGWLTYHTYDSRRSKPGFPDLVMARGSSLVFAELKSMVGKPTPEQKTWLEALSEVQTVSCHLWKPSDWQAVEHTLVSGGQPCQRKGR